MKAAVWTRYGPPEVLQLQEVEKPIPKDDEVLVRIRATTVSAGDCEMRRLEVPMLLRLPTRLYVGVRRPKRIAILGQELAGEVEAVGKAVTLFGEGDPVIAATGFSQGAYAQYLNVNENPTEGVLARKPDGLSYEEAATLPFGALDALHFLRQGDVRAGEKVVVNGAGGSIGTFAVQLAKNMGAQVSAVDLADKLDMLSSLGADEVIDYTTDDFTESGERFDVIFDVVGKSPFARSMRSLKPGGRYISANPAASLMLRGPLASLMSNKRVILRTARKNADDVRFLTELIDAGRLRTVIDRCYPLEEIAEAHRYVETGQKRGHVVITVK